MEVYLCISDWCESCGGRVYHTGRKLGKDEYEQNNFIRTNPRIIIIGEVCRSCGKKLTTIKQHITCTDSEGDYWYQSVDTIDYSYKPLHGSKGLICTACNIEKDSLHTPNMFPSLGLEFDAVRFCECGIGIVRGLKDNYNKQTTLKENKMGIFNNYFERNKDVLINAVIIVCMHHFVSNGELKRKATGALDKLATNLVSKALESAIKEADKSK